MQLDKYSGCGAKVVTDAADPEIGTCVKCKMMQCINAGKEEFSAHIMVKAQRVFHCVPSGKLLKTSAKSLQER